MGWYASKLGSIECHHTLSKHNAIVEFAHGDHDWSIPVLHKLMWRVCKSALSNGIVFIPECAAHIPVGKPHFFSFKVLALDVEDAGMSNESSKSALVMACKPIYRKTSIACSNGTNVFCVDIWLILHIVDCT